MPKTDHDRALALAGVFQATALVRDIAHTGQMDWHDFETCLTSLFKLDAASSEDVYGGIVSLKTGLRLVSAQLRNPSDMVITRYVITLLTLERKLAKRPELLQKIREGIESTAVKLQYFPLTHENIIANLADLYSATISTLSPRVIVNGEHVHLTNPENANRIRALLLAGLRSAVLWRQNGGGRLTLLLRRQSLLRETQTMLASLE